MKLIIALGALISLSIVSDSALGQGKDDDVFTIVETKPQFPGGDAAMYKFLWQNMRYPEDAKEQQVEGTVTVVFVIQADGVIDSTTVSVIEGLFPSCDLEATRLIKSFPRWSPGRRSNGDAVKVRLALPVFFKLPKEKKAKKRKKLKKNER